MTAAQTGPATRPGNEVWSRGPIDALAHAQGHFAVDSDLDRRHALVAFDQAIEAVVTAYLHFGPGLEDGHALARRAREPKATFWPKAKYVARRAKLLGRPLPVDNDDLNLIHSLRNELQHAGRWVVPRRELVAAARGAAIAAFAALGLAPPGSDDPSSAPPQVPDRLIASEPNSPPQLRGDRRPLVLVAYEIAREIDPEAEGVHIRHLAERLSDRGVNLGRNPVRTLYDSLNRAHLNFSHLRPAIFIWKEPDDRDPGQGIRGRALADAVYAFAIVNDPEQRGLNLSAEVMAGLRHWQIPIRGVDMGATLNEAVRRDARFVRVAAGTYRWVSAPATPPPDRDASSGVPGSNGSINGLK